jgi:hypothetical protein
MHLLGSSEPQSVSAESSFTETRVQVESKMRLIVNTKWRIRSVLIEEIILIDR